MTKVRIAFRTLGCKVNQYETQGIREHFQGEDYEEVHRKADVYLINTCTVTHEAGRECLEYDTRDSGMKHRRNALPILTRQGPHQVPSCESP